MIFSYIIPSCVHNYQLLSLASYIYYHLSSNIRYFPKAMKIFPNFYAPAPHYLEMIVVVAAVVVIHWCLLCARHLRHISSLLTSPEE